MKKPAVILLGIALCSSACVYGPPPPPAPPPPPVAGPAVGVTIAVGDRPYYNRGAFYVERGVRYVWVPGHWAHHRHGPRYWVHGHYAVR